jgi:hypothetical protein
MASADFRVKNGLTVDGNATVVGTSLSLGTSTAALTTATVGGAITGNILKVAGTTSGTANITTDVTTGTFNLVTGITTGTVNIATSGASNTNIGGAAASLTVGTTSGNSTITINGNATSGTATLTTNSGVSTANMFNTNATTINAFGAGTAIGVGANTGYINIYNPTIRGSYATQFFLNGASPSIKTTSTGTASVFNDTALTGNLFAESTTVNIGYTGSSTAATYTQNYSTGYVGSGATKTINIGTAGIGFSTTNVNIGSNFGGTTTFGTPTVNINTSTGAYQINGTTVLNATTLGSGVTSSSLTTVGTIGTGVWNGTVITGQYGGTGVVNTSKTITLGGNLTTSGAFTTTLTVGANTNVTLPASGTLVGSNDTGTVTNTMLAGSIANAKLSNSAITINSASTSLGSSVTIYAGTTTLQTTSANQGLTGISSVVLPGSTSGTITLQPTATAGTNTITLPATTGTVVTTGDSTTVTNTMLAGSIANAKLTNSTITIGTTAISLGSSSTTLGGLTSVTFSGATSGTIQFSPTTVAGTTVLTLPATTGTLVTTGDSATVTNTMLAGSIANAKLSNSTISGIALGSNLSTLTISTGLTGTSYNGSTGVTIAVDSTTVALKADVHYVGTTSIALNRASAAQSLTGITSIDGYAAGLAGGNATTLLGSLPYQSAANTTTLLSPNTTTTRKFLTQTGNGTNGAAPAWTQTYTTSATAPSGPVVGDCWYKSGSDIFYQYVNDGTSSFWLSLNTYPSSYANLGVTSTLTVSGTVSSSLIPTGNNVYNLGSASAYWGTVYGKATSAQYADLAEKYTADDNYEPGTVLEFGGTNEVTISNTDMSRKIAGIVSTNPGYLMNAELKSEFVVSLALTGRVPCKVQGKVRKGDMMVSASNGYARAEEDPKLGSVIGKALEDFNGITGIIEVVVGRL